MSSYGNHVWTPERESVAHKLVHLAMDCDDDGFAETLHGIAGIGVGWPFGGQAAPMHTADPVKAISGPAGGHRTTRRKTCRTYRTRTGRHDRPMTGQPRRIQLRRTRGWRKPDGAIVVARPTRWGNPFTGNGDRALAVARYREWLEGPSDYRIGRGKHWYTRPLAEELQSLRGKDLCCWCPPGQPCHAEVLLEWANR